MTSQIEIMIDSEIKNKAEELFMTLGLDMSTAINLFLRECVLRGELPFEIEKPDYNEEVIAAMNEALCISKDPNVKGYDSIEKLKEFFGILPADASIGKDPNERD